MADPSFFVKVGIECGIGIGTKCAAESKKRGDAFKSELDFVTANVIMAIIADFMLVWLPAPTMSFATANSCRQPTNAIARFFACCPENAFQKVPKGTPPSSPHPQLWPLCAFLPCSTACLRWPCTPRHRVLTNTPCLPSDHAARLRHSHASTPQLCTLQHSVLPTAVCCAGFPAWSVAQRAAAPVRNGAKLLGVGFAASMLGVGITNGLIACRKLMNPDYPDSGQAQNPLVVSSAYAAYMASSSNIRYQVVAGVLEERGIEVRPPFPPSMRPHAQPCSRCALPAAAIRCLRRVVTLVAPPPGPGSARAVACM